jgi:hypothetical protein
MAAISVLLFDIAAAAILLAVALLGESHSVLLIGIRVILEINYWQQQSFLAAPNLRASLNWKQVSDLFVTRCDTQPQIPCSN